MAIFNSKLLVYQRVKSQSFGDLMMVSLHSSCRRRRDSANASSLGKTLGESTGKARSMWSAEHLRC